MDVFEEEYKLSPTAIIPVFYNQDLQNRYSATFTQFLHIHLEHPYIKKLIKSAFVDFFENVVCLYPNYQSYTLNSIGSIGLIFSDQLKEVADFYKMTIGKIIKSPIEGLIEYHQGKRD